MFYNMDILFVVLTGELLTHLFLWLFKWVSVLCGNNRDGLKCEWMVDEDGGWKKNMKCFGFFHFSIPFPSSLQKAIFLPSAAGTNVLKLGSCVSACTLSYIKGSALVFRSVIVDVAALKSPISFSSFEANVVCCAGISPFLAKRMKH